MPNLSVMASAHATYHEPDRHRDEKRAAAGCLATWYQGSTPFSSGSNDISLGPDGSSRVRNIPSANRNTEASDVVTVRYHRAAASLRSTLPWSAYRGTSAFAEVEGGRSPVAQNLSTSPSAPFSTSLRAARPSKTNRCDTWCVGDSVDGFGTHLLMSWRWPHTQHGGNGCLVCLLIAAASLTYLSVSQRSRRHAGLRSSVRIGGTFDGHATNGATSIGKVKGMNLQRLRRVVLVCRKSLRLPKFRRPHPSPAGVVTSAAKY